MLAYFKITSYNKYNKDSSGDGWFLVVWWCMPNMYNMHKDVQCMPLFFVGVLLWMYRSGGERLYQSRSDSLVDAFHHHW